MRFAMSDTSRIAFSPSHSHVFLGEGHEKSERKTWAVIWLCGVMMVAEIIGFRVYYGLPSRTFTFVRCAF
jgi:hypothetical protein